ncbi:MAG: NAD-dependent epimerase/dehydratase family protein, partial [Firmicutes bacterium]|nr:NAD-dependent epimerase/dehydratase family protein [Bacillota bacterium]
MRKLYLITGGTGHLGQNVVRLLLQNQNDHIRVLTLPGDPTPLPDGVERITGDVCDASSLTPFFDTAGYDTAVLYHLAAYITIASKNNPKVWRVNVEGTRNVMDLALRSQIARVVYVSTVHAIPELPHSDVIAETNRFSSDSVHGQYAKSKAAAAELVLQFAKRGLNVSIVHPSGIIGPGDTQKTNHMTRTIEAMASGRIPVSIGGGYDFVDVRDVAAG